MHIKSVLCLPSQYFGIGPFKLYSFSFSNPLLRIVSHVHWYLWHSTAPRLLAWTVGVNTKFPIQFTIQGISVPISLSYGPGIWVITSTSLCSIHIASCASFLIGRVLPLQEIYILFCLDLAQQLCHLPKLFGTSGHDLLWILSEIKHIYVDLITPLHH